MPASNFPALLSSGTPAEHIEEQVARPLEDHDSVVMRLRHIDLGLLPTPPASAQAWRERAMHMCEGMPGLRDHLTSVPIGWFSLIEVAVAESRHLLPDGQAIETSQIKEKYGTLRWYCHVVTGPDGWDYSSPAIAPMDWAEEASGRVCAALGTPDGDIDRSTGWLLTLSPPARRMRQSPASAAQGMSLSTLMYPPWVDA